MERATGPARSAGPRVDPLQVAAALAAVYLLVIGIVAIARGGFFGDGLTEPVVAVGLIHATPALALGLVIAGLVLLWAGVGEVTDVLAIRVVAGIVLVLGIVLVIEPGAFRPALGSEPGDGWHHVLLGGGLLAVSFAPPVTLGSRASVEPPNRHGDPPNDGTTRRIR